MLQRLYIKNYALIDEIDIRFDQALTIVTGETGAGKSIILGALSLILGERAASNTLYDDQQKCIVEGSFNIAAYKLHSFFEEEELDYNDQTIIRREITPSGKSRVFINDTPANLVSLKKLCDKLVNLHAQHQTLHLYDANYQLFLIDIMANHQPLLQTYKTLFNEWQANKRNLSGLKNESSRLQKELDYLNFQLEEFEKANFTNPEEQTLAEQELAQLNNAENIQRVLLEAINLLENNEELAIIRILSQLRSSFSGLTKFGKSYAEIQQRLENTIYELRDLNSEISNLENAVLHDPQRAEELTQRLNTIYRLQKKHGVNTLADLMAIEVGLAAQKLTASNVEQNIAQLEQTIAANHKKVLETAQLISKQRQAQIPILQNHISQMLARVGMPDAQLLAQLTANENHPTANGIDEVDLLFAANKGSAPNELRKVASGGELSRLMLCLQTLIAKHTALPTLIFDEIDTGISGEVALKVGRVMHELGMQHQVLCITHLPQIASMGQAHLLVHKEVINNRTYTRMRPIKGEDRIIEIAKMLSGDPPPESAKENAKALLQNGLLTKDN